VNKIKAVLAGETFATETQGGWASISKSEIGIDVNGDVFGGEVVISFGKDALPSFNTIVVSDANVEKEMRNIQSDLRKWN